MKFILCCFGDFDSWTFSFQTIDKIAIAQNENNESSRNYWNHIEKVESGKCLMFRFCVGHFVLSIKK